MPRDRKKEIAEADAARDRVERILARQKGRGGKKPPKSASGTNPMENVRVLKRVTSSVRKRKTPTAVRAE